MYGAAEELETPYLEPYLELAWEDYLDMEPYVTHVKAGWWPYNNWKFDNWREVVQQLSELNILMVQIGGPHDPPIKGVKISLIGQPFERNLDALAGTKLHMGVDSWSNHATNVHCAGKGQIPGGDRLGFHAIDCDRLQAKPKYLSKSPRVSLAFVKIPRSRGCRAESVLIQAVRPTKTLDMPA